MLDKDGGQGLRHNKEYLFAETVNSDLRLNKLELELIHEAVWQNIQSATSMCQYRYFEMTTEP